MENHFEATREFAKSLDAQDELAHFRQRFYQVKDTFTWTEIPLGFVPVTRKKQF